MLSLHVYLRKQSPNDCAWRYSCFRLGTGGTHLKRGYGVTGHRNHVEIDLFSMVKVRYQLHMHQKDLCRISMQRSRRVGSFGSETLVPVERVWGSKEVCIPRRQVNAIRFCVSIKSTSTRLRRQSTSSQRWTIEHSLKAQKCLRRVWDLAKYIAASSGFSSAEIENFSARIENLTSTQA